MKYVVLFFCILTASCAGVTGTPKVISGDTIIVDGERIRAQHQQRNACIRRRCGGGAALARNLDITHTNHGRREMRKRRQIT